MCPSWVVRRRRPCGGPVGQGGPSRRRPFHQGRARPVHQALAHVIRGLCVPLNKGSRREVLGDPRRRTLSNARYPQGVFRPGRKWQEGFCHRVCGNAAATRENWFVLDLTIRSRSPVRPR
jgi:hypothetical protein